MSTKREPVLNFSIHIAILVPIIILIGYGFLKRVPLPADFVLIAMTSTSFYHDAKKDPKNRKTYFGISLISAIVSLWFLIDYLQNFKNS